MKTLLLRLEPDLDRHLTEICEREGYQKTGLLRKLIRDFVATSLPRQDPIAEAQAFGIDVHRLRENLRKSPAERLMDLGEAQAFAQKLKKIGDEK